MQAAFQIIFSPLGLCIILLVLLASLVRLGAAIILPTGPSFSFNRNGMKNLIAAIFAMLRMSRAPTEGAIHRRSIASGLQTPLAVGLFKIISGAVIVAAIAIGCIIVARGHPLIWGFLVGAAGICMPCLWLRHQRYKHHQILKATLPDALDLLVVAAHHELGFRKSFEMVIDRVQFSSPPLSASMNSLAEALQQHDDTETALSTWSATQTMPDLLTFATLVIQSERHDAPLPDALQLLAGDIRGELHKHRESLAKDQPRRLALAVILITLPTFTWILSAPVLGN